MQYVTITEFPYEALPFTRLSLAMLLPKLQTYIVAEGKLLQIPFQPRPMTMVDEQDYVLAISHVDLTMPWIMAQIERYYHASFQHDQLLQQRKLWTAAEVRERRITIVANLTECYHGFLKYYYAARSEAFA